MYQTLSQRKREILMRSAEARVALMDSVDETCRGVRGCVATLPVPGRALRYGLLAGAGVTGVALLRRMFRARRATVPTPSHSLSGSGVLRYLLMQVVTLVLLPWVRQMALQGRVGNMVKRLRPAQAFFRWLGLEQ